MSIIYKYQYLIDDENIHFDYLELNPKAIPLLQYLKRINWSRISQNSEAIHLIMKNIDRIDWFNLSGNPSAIPLLETYSSKINWYMLSSNPAAIGIIREHLRFEDSLSFATYMSLDNSNKVSWAQLAKNPKAMPIIKEFIRKYLRYENIIDDELDENSRYGQHFYILWYNIWENSNAFQFLWENHRERIAWQPFSANTSVDAIKHLRQRIEDEKGMDLNHPDNYNKIDWGKLSRNSSAFDLLNENKDKIHWDGLCCNTNPKVMKLIEAKFREEPYRAGDEWGHMRPHEKLYWHGLSRNPAIFIKKGLNDK